MPPPIPPPSPRHLLPPLLASLPAAAVSSEPPAVLLPFLTPILRQRVQLLSASTQDPWLPLLCYGQDKATKLSDIARSDRFEPHPVSGEVEVDWESEAQTTYRRIDEETLEAYTSLREFELRVKLLWCVGDQEGGGDGWRIGEVSLLDILPLPSASQVWESIGEAEGKFKESSLNGSTVPASNLLKPKQANKGTNGNTTHPALDVEDEEDDDDYWAQYDNTPARTPAVKRSPAPDALQNGSKTLSDEDAYYAQYGSVQPVMDNHDPDEATLPTNGDGTVQLTLDHSTSTSTTYPTLPSTLTTELVHPRPTSSSSSSSGTSTTIARLEHEAAKDSRGSQEPQDSPVSQHPHPEEQAIKQHISTSVKSLYRLARAAGVDRKEFERLVKTELEVLGLMEED